MAGEKEQLTSDQCRQLRQANSVPLLESISQWLHAQRDRVLPKSPIGQATAYALKNWQALCRYPADGDLSIDNNISERALRAQAIGRKNWLFAGSDNGGQTAAVLFSLIASCKHNRVEPYEYLDDVLRRLPSIRPKDIDALFPDRWFQCHPSAVFDLNRSA
jgi:hypothetical protein